MRVLFVLLLALVAVALAKNARAASEWDLFKVQFNKTYKSVEEHDMRYRIFEENLHRVSEMNLRHKGGEDVFGVTKFSDLTPSEFDHLYLMPQRPKPVIPADKVLNKHHFSNGTIPATWDWTTQGLKNGHSAITAIYNQGQCGSCWAFSATEQIESMTFLQGKVATPGPRHLSQQQIVDCDTTAYGCDGGWTYWAYAYVISAGGQDTGASYPYTAEDGTCKFKPANVGAKISAWHYVTSTKDETVMENYVGTTGPLSVCVDASSWQFYNGGVLRTCGTSIDHCVQIVGYTTMSGLAAWKVRNSWGADWGVQGFLFIERNKDLCAIAQVVTTVTGS